ncbi:MoaD/ThiS family protein [Sediminitomix flava]|uniref:Molybdopterin synthase subunit MoaD n=1 Tax=Sediminitomix flava TaxID=379075 RepID=A0A315ZFP7_SEDFL|nr:MoaD/ThiS family protein [Sediminitomix flava]PWJ44331.1 molybdopterin synthase subunit MoaD [Sediminitomix flava]
MNRLTIKYFGILSDKVGKDSEEWEVPSNAKVSDLLHLVHEKYPVVADFTYMISQNHKMTNKDASLSQAAELALLPPFAGG